MDQGGSFVNMSGLLHDAAINHSRLIQILYETRTSDGDYENCTLLCVRVLLSNLEGAFSPDDLAIRFNCVSGRMAVQETPRVPHVAVGGLRFRIVYRTPLHLFA